MKKSLLEDDEELDRKISAVAEKTEFREGAVLFHPVHGPCVVKEILQKPELGGLCYWLQPREAGPARANFFVGVSRLRKEGFHPPLSTHKAKMIIEYLRKGPGRNVSRPEDRIEQISSLIQDNTPLAFVKILHLLSRVKTDKFMWKEREGLDHAIGGLIQEIAFVMKISAASAAGKVRQSLSRTLRANPHIRKLLERLSRDEDGSGMEND